MFLAAVLELDDLRPIPREGSGKRLKAVQPLALRKPIVNPHEVRRLHGWCVLRRWGFQLCQFIADFLDKERISESEFANVTLDIARYIQIQRVEALFCNPKQVFHRPTWDFYMMDASFYLGLDINRVESAMRNREYNDLQAFKNS